MSRLRAHWLLLAILLTHFSLGVLYSLVIPIWEAPDERAHFAYVSYIATNRSLPKSGEEAIPEYYTLVRPGGQAFKEWDELSQPPLYYLLGALFTSWLDSDPELGWARNPHVWSGGGYNFFVHPEGSPTPSTSLAVHIVRLVSVVLSTLVVFATYLLGRVIVPSSRGVALGAAVINAFSPHFVFMGSVVNNDVAVALFSSLCLIFAVKVSLGDSRVWGLLGMGLFFILALFSKYNALALLPAVLVSVVIVAVRWVKLPLGRSRHLAAVLLLALLVLLVFWLLRGPISSGVAARFPGELRSFLRALSDPLSAFRAMRWDLLPDMIGYNFITFWASFGWGNLWAEPWIYGVLAITSLLASLGVMIFFWRGPQRRDKAAAVLLLLSILSTFILAVYRPLRGGHTFLPGRYLFPSLSAIYVLFALGVAQLTPRRFLRGLFTVMGVGFFLWALVVPFRYILPAYLKPAVLSPDQVPTSLQTLSVRYGGRMELLGYEPMPSKTLLGDNLRLTLYWRSTERIESNYTIAIRLLGAGDSLCGYLDTYPGNGNYATSLWKPGEVIRDTYPVKVLPDCATPTMGRISLAVLDEGWNPLPVYDGEGHAIGDVVMFGRIKLASGAPSAPVIGKPVHYRYGDTVGLIGYNVEELFDGLRVSLYWQALQETDKDYTVFVHLVDEKGRVVSQEDSQPRGGSYPTSLWEKGEVILDEHHLPLPADMPKGEYSLLVGFYLLDTMERLPAYDQEGVRLVNDQVILSDIRITREGLAPQVPIAVLIRKQLWLGT